MERPNVNPNGPFWPEIRSFVMAGLAYLADRELDHGFAGRDLLASLVLHHDVDQDPARLGGRLLRFDDPCRLDGVARPDRLDPPGFEAAVDGARGIGPVGNHPRDQPRIFHGLHDYGAEIGLSENALY